jgi:hypothetical protein
VPAKVVRRSTAGVAAGALMAIPHGLGAAPNIRAVIAFASYQSATGVAGQKNTSVRMATGVATWDAGGVQQMAFGSANSRTESYNDALLHIPQDADSNGGYSGYRSIGLTVEPANPPDAVNIYVRLSRPYVPAENFLVHFLILYGAHISARAVPFLQAAGNNVAQTITGPAWTPTSAVSFTPPVISQEWGEGGGNAGEGAWGSGMGFTDGVNQGLVAVTRPMGGLPTTSQSVINTTRFAGSNFNQQERTAYEFLSFINAGAPRGMNVTRREPLAYLPATGVLFLAGIGAHLYAVNASAVDGTEIPLAHPGEQAIAIIAATTNRGAASQSFAVDVGGEVVYGVSDGVTSGGVWAIDEDNVNPARIAHGAYDDALLVHHNAVAPFARAAAITVDPFTPGETVLVQETPDATTPLLLAFVLTEPAEDEPTVHEWSATATGTGGGSITPRKVASLPAGITGAGSGAAAIGGVAKVASIALAASGSGAGALSGIAKAAVIALAAAGSGASTLGGVAKVARLPGAITAAGDGGGTVAGWTLITPGETVYQWSLTGGGVGGGTITPRKVASITLTATGAGGGSVRFAFPAILIPSSGYRARLLNASTRVRIISEPEPS